MGEVPDPGDGGRQERRRVSHHLLGRGRGRTGACGRTWRLPPARRSRSVDEALWLFGFGGLKRF